jgi:hypothetical protein
VVHLNSELGANLELLSHRSYLWPTTTTLLRRTGQTGNVDSDDYYYLPGGLPDFPLLGNLQQSRTAVLPLLGTNL